MQRPKSFQWPFAASRNIPYQCVDGEGQGSASGGVLSEGQKVWLSSDVRSTEQFAQTMAFVEGVGLVCLETRWLIPVEE